MKSTLRLEDCGDFLSLSEYCRWRGESERTVRRQLKTLSCFVMPREEKPHLKWQTRDCQQRMERANVVRERQQRAKAQLSAEV